MGWLFGLLKEIPLSAVLKEKITSIEAKHAAIDTENAILKDDLRHAKTEIAKLTKQVEQLSHKEEPPHVELDDTEIDLLKLIADLGYDNSTTEMIRLNRKQIPEQKLEYHLERLVQAGFILNVIYLPEAGWFFAMTQEGRTFLVGKGLL
jgi:predicted RNase H-like nuclease (RuvC/YqgF family)